MRVHAPDGDDGPFPAFVVLRGGGYARNDGSGNGTAAWLAAHGYVGVEVDYRTRATADAHPAPFADAARAMRLVRANATAWRVDPARIGAIGYSAGGHLATLLATQPALHVEPADDLAAISPRPDLLVLAYPLISFIDGYAAGAFYNSVDNFFGHATHDDAARRRYASELHVAAAHPPAFVWTTADDAIVPASHARGYVAACRAAGVPVTYVEFPSGPHGMGLALDRGGDVATWPTQLIAWLRARDWATR